ncbi:hypothetical protein [Methanogenium cariaci]|uniref:hypothetical protein n=1 Tax=Methanogenium cariaci TaxID=2197 RepID=UPI001FE1B5E8|nr:hypothetical protein [Methanogenium cariaci]
MRVADTIAYLGRDLQDAIEIGCLDSSLPGLPNECRETFSLKGDHRRYNASIIDTVCRDVIAGSFNRGGEVRFSPEVSACVQALKQYNYAQIYENAVLHAQMIRSTNSLPLSLNGSSPTSKRSTRTLLSTRISSGRSMSPPRHISRRHRPQNWCGTISQA